MKIRNVLQLFIASTAIVLAGVAYAVAGQIAPVTVDFKKIIPPPPADESPAGMADLETLLLIQQYRTEEQVKEAKRVDTQSACGFARPVFGEWLRSADFPKTNENLNAIGKVANSICDNAKSFWKRQRPYQRDTRIKPATGHPGNNSYPSGHTFGATIWSIVYAEAFPEHAQEFDALAHRTMWGRVLAGVHYPSDTTAAYTLAQAVGKELLKDPEVQRRIKEIREEIQTKRPKDAK